MCGIAGLIYRDGSRNIGGEMTAMLQALKHRGPDSTGFAIYGEPGPNQYILRFKVAEKEDLGGGTRIHRAIAERKAAVDTPAGGARRRRPRPRRADGIREPLPDRP